MAKKNAPAADPLIITRSQLIALSPAEQQAFRSKGGTVVEDPGYGEGVESPEEEQTQEETQE